MFLYFQVMVFKQLLDTRLQMFLMFNPDSANVLSTPCEVRYLFRFSTLERSLDPRARGSFYDTLSVMVIDLL